jgi:hypothetical protein
VFATRLIPLILVAPFLFAAAKEESDPSADQRTSERRRALETYVQQMEALLEKQTRSVAATPSSEEVEMLQVEHREWKRERDLRCAQEQGGDTARIRELECIADSAELHFEHRQTQIDTLEGKFIPENPYVLRAPKDISELLGAYHRGGGMLSISLNLKQDRSYLAISRGCLGEYGRSAGTWSLEEGRILFRPIEESDSMKGRFTELYVGYQDANLFLFPNPNVESFQQFGPRRFTVFSRRDERSPE